MDDGLNSMWLAFWMLLSPLLLVAVSLIIVTAPLWISFLAAQMLHGGVAIRNKIERKKNSKEPLFIMKHPKHEPYTETRLSEHFFAEEREKNTDNIVHQNKHNHPTK
ncbi:hypothetical protein ACWPKO_03130 [Coraliomargarita sp. W4R53]